MEALGYEIKVIKSPKDTSKDPDLTKPYLDSNKNEYYFVEYLTQKKTFDGVKDRAQSRPYTKVISSAIRDTQIMFADITDCISLGEGAGYTKLSSGLKLNPSEYGKVGNLILRNVPPHYVLLPDGSKLKVTMGPKAGEDAVRTEVYVFVPINEDPDVYVNREIARIPEEAWIKANE